MDMELEREKLQEQCMRFSKYTALVREGTVGPYRRSLQYVQNMVLVKFLTIMQEKAFRLIRSPEEAKEIGEDNLELLQIFSEEYANLLELEYQWCGDSSAPSES